MTRNESLKAVIYVTLKGVWKSGGFGDHAPTDQGDGTSNVPTTDRRVNLNNVDLF